MTLKVDDAEFGNTTGQTAQYIIKDITSLSNDSSSKSI
jgi:hypothetical protein